jgi:hypothetical protein
MAESGRDCPYGCIRRFCNRAAFTYRIAGAADLGHGHFSIVDFGGQAMKETSARSGLSTEQREFLDTKFAALAGEICGRLLGLLGLGIVFLVAELIKQIGGVWWELVWMSTVMVACKSLLYFRTWRL